MTLLGIVVTGMLIYQNQKQYLERNLGLMLLNIARTGALLIDRDLHADVVSARDPSSLAYQQIRAVLSQIQLENDLIDPVYTVVDFDADNSTARFMVISQGETRPGETYRLVPAIIKPLSRTLQEGKASFTAVYYNEHGAWITAFAPIRDAAGHIIGALDVDYRAAVYLELLGQQRQTVLFFSLAGSIVALLLGVVVARRITRPVNALTATARRVVEGDLSQRVVLTSNDEFGLMGNIFNLMTDRLQRSHEALLGVLVQTLEAQSWGTPGELARLARCSIALGKQIGLRPAQLQALEVGALLHHIGNVSVPPAILTKSEPLSDDEWALVRTHPEVGRDILETVPFLASGIDVAVAHHERFDGKGYPNRLAGDLIPTTARIFAVVEAINAMTHPYPQHQPLSLESAVEKVRLAAGSQFDPRIVEAFLAIPADRWRSLFELKS
jgi:HD-GYP domain-containing protein (c-di-GMP phosphodiesterase class II)